MRTIVLAVVLFTIFYVGAYALFGVTAFKAISKACKGQSLSHCAGNGIGTIGKDFNKGLNKGGK